MRWYLLAALLVCCLAIGCGDAGGPATASADGSGAAPPPPDAGPAAPPDDGGDGGGMPMETPDGGEPAAEEQPPANDNPPPDSEGTIGSPDGAATPDGTDGAGGQPGESPDESNPDGTPRKPARPLTLREQAMAAFRDGRDALGARLLMAYYVAAPEAQQELVKKMAWIPALSRPALAPRIGMAVHYTDASSPKDFRGNPMPIGSPELTSAIDGLESSEQSDNRIGGTRRASKFSRGAPRETSDLSEGNKEDSMAQASGPVQLSFYTGELGEKLLDAIEERFETGEFGLVVQDVLREVGQVRSSRGRGDASGAPDGDPLGGGFASDGGEIDPQSGAPRRGATAKSALDGVYDTSKQRRWTSRSAAQEAKVVAELKQISPCVWWLGKQLERDEIMKRAELGGIDLLIIFEMTVREARTGNLVNSTTRLRLVTTKGNKAVPGFSPEPLVNITVEQWRQKEEKGLDPVDKEVTKAIEALDTVLKPTALPEALTAERAKKRIDDLVAEKPADPLPAIVEARFYAAKGLIKNQDFLQAAFTLLGKNGFAQLQAKAKSE